MASNGEHHNGDSGDILRLRTLPKGSPGTPQSGSSKTLGHPGSRRKPVPTPRNTLKKPKITARTGQNGGGGDSQVCEKCRKMTATGKSSSSAENCAYSGIHESGGRSSFSGETT